MVLIPILEHAEENPELIGNPLCQDSIYMSIDFYKKVGYNAPWIGYYAEENGELIGCAAFKGKPVNGSVEIAYGTFEKFRQQGVGKRICQTLVELAIQTDPSVRITARTLPENNYSTKILKSNHFLFVGNVFDPEDGEVWEWEYPRELYGLHENINDK
jgi:[ribosomal protein S5]-alanine N-acetyltransferase